MTQKLAFALTFALAVLSTPLLAASPAPAVPTVAPALAVQAAVPAVGMLPAWNPAIIPPAPQPASAQNLDALLPPLGVISCPRPCDSTNCPESCSCLWVGWCVQCEC